MPDFRGAGLGAVMTIADHDRVGNLLDWTPTVRHETCRLQ